MSSSTNSQIRCLVCQQTLTSIDQSITERLVDWSVDHRQSSLCLAPPISANQAQAGTSSADKIGHHTTQVGNLYDIIRDSKSPLDGPMCQECTDKLLEGMDSELKALEDECTVYKKMIDNLQSGNTFSTIDSDAIRIQLTNLTEEEKVLRSELKRLEMDEKEMAQHLDEENARYIETKKEEERLWRTYRDLCRSMLDLEADEQSATAKLAYTSAQLAKLSKTNVFNLTFHIWHSGHFGTINGFRLGRLPDDQVEWSEINAAWGQTVLLLKCLSRKIGLKLVDYELVPLGSASYIRCIGIDLKDKDLPLYCTGGIKLLGHSKFDQGMVAFIDCLRQLQTHIEQSGGFHLPHAMQRDKIEDQKIEYSVKMQFNSEERWTKAMKCMLTNLKWALAWVAAMP